MCRLIQNNCIFFKNKHEDGIIIELKRYFMLELNYFNIKDKNSQRPISVWLKTLLSEGLSKPEFYGDLVYKFKKLIGINDFSFQFRKIIRL